MRPWPRHARHAPDAGQEDATAARSTQRRAPRRAWVTGASAGIGRAFAEELAGRGWRLVLVARRRARLEALAEALHARHGVQVDVRPCDLTDPEALRDLERRLARDRQLELLVNDAGLGDFGAFLEHGRDLAEQEIRLNVLALTRLTHAAAAPMRRRGRGGVINVSSSAAFQPGPLFAVYAATKAFVNSFSEALAFELRESGVRVQALCPGLTHTEIFRQAGADTSRLPEFLWMEPDAVVRESLAALERGSGVVVPGLGNRALSSLTRLLPHELSERVAAAIMGRVEPQRRRGRPRRDARR